MATVGVCLVGQGYSRELFQFEEDRFDNVPALIRFYVGGRRPISQASGAIVFHPLTRTLPLRVIAERQRDDCKGADGRSADGKSRHERGKRLSIGSTLGDALNINPLLRWAGEGGRGGARPPCGGAGR